MENIATTNTAHQEWDLRWKTEEGRKAWSVPAKDVVEVLDLLKERGTKKVLDLGCGVGRHSILLAKSGFAVHALDGSDTGIAHLEDMCKAENIDINATCAEMTNLPYQDSYFDYILAWNVIYHGNLSVVKRVLSEVLRILKPGGIFQLTMLSKRNSEYNHGKCISLNTFVNDADISDKNHPHFYCSSSELMQLLMGFEIISSLDKQQVREGSYHWNIVAEKI